MREKVVQVYGNLSSDHGAFRNESKDRWNSITRFETRKHTRYECNLSIPTQISANLGYGQEDNHAASILPDLHCDPGASVSDIIHWFVSGHPLPSSLVTTHQIVRSVATFASGPLSSWPHVKRFFGCLRVGVQKRFHASCRNTAHSLLYF